jgi:hypothetical protein
LSFEAAGSASIAASNEGLRHFCATCGSPLYLSRADRPGSIKVFAGTLDQPEAFKPAFHVFAGSKARWLELESGTRLFAERAVAFATDGGRTTR